MDSLVPNLRGKVKAVPGMSRSERREAYKANARNERKWIGTDREAEYDVPRVSKAIQIADASGAGLF